MSIVTKTGDDGTTAIFSGKRLTKDDAQIEACGAVDEATSFVGFAIESISEKQVKNLLSDVQVHLYLIMAYLSGSSLDVKRIKKHLSVIESAIQKYENTLPRLTRFILPQGSEQTSRLHIGRAMVRSAERRVTCFLYNKDAQNKNDALTLQYMNRLSDLLFILARFFDKNEAIAV